ncbi:uncharacterized protein [Musca autumnalis]|uniref:uncharacterized protein n=1 Tax=Musca autumnalis TaxID=221902 RepID=UPI003CFB62BC
MMLVEVPADDKNSSEEDDKDNDGAPRLESYRNSEEEIKCLKTSMGLMNLPVTKITEQVTECRNYPETDDYLHLYPKLLKLVMSCSKIVDPFRMLYFLLWVVAIILNTRILWIVYDRNKAPMLVNVLSMVHPG